MPYLRFIQIKIRQMVVGSGSEDINKMCSITVSVLFFTIVPVNIVFLYVNMISLITCSN